MGRFRVIAQDQEIEYCQNPPLSDPLGLVYWLNDSPAVGAPLLAMNSAGIAVLAKPAVKRPLILRCRKGEWIEVELWNKIPAHLGIEPQAPAVPVERFDRAVSGQVSIHADPLSYDVTQSDGTNVGYNHNQTVPRQHKPARQPQGTVLFDKRVYRWFADVEGPVLLQDFADFRNHRHHGLIGALIVEAAHATWDVLKPDHAIVTTQGQTHEEMVVVIQDGLRHFLFGNLSLPMGGPAGDPGQAGPDPTDQGQKAFSYRSQPIGKPDWMHVNNPSAPTFELDSSSTHHF